MKKFIIFAVLILLLIPCGKAIAQTTDANTKPWRDPSEESVSAEFYYAITISRNHKHITVNGFIEIKNTPSDVCRKATEFTNNGKRIRHILEQIGFPSEKGNIVGSINCSSSGKITIYFNFTLPNKDYSIDDIEKIVDLIKKHFQEK